MSESIPDFYAPNRSFMGAARVEPEQIKDYQYAMLGIPFSEGSFIPYIQTGQSAMPNALRDNPVTIFYDVGDVGLYDVDYDITLLEGTKICDVGDVVISPGEGRLTRQRITNSVKHILAAGAVPFCVGGDHSVTYPIIRAYANSLKVMDFVYFDAHLDFANMPLDSEFNHGTQTRHIRALPFVRNITVIGARNSTAQEFREAREAGINIISVKDVCKSDINKLMTQIIDPATPTYVSLDIDAMDAIVVPGTTHPETGGLSFEQQKECLYELAKAAKGHVCGFDVVELVPHQDVNHITALTASKLTALMMGYIEHFKP
ncbi:arginase family protein [Paraferrimonas sp. SM1919]|uniref:arginase family protein n=1 Tax=Paraferrimonas sp. SM1919 TaxID=2662263 RepID=UPI0013D087F8|nr:arginase family protein [Paraferrimonas sp. SM1919]